LRRARRWRGPAWRDLLSRSKTERSSPLRRVHSKLARPVPPPSWFCPLRPCALTGAWRVA